MANYERNAKADWERLKQDIKDWFGESRQNIGRYIPLEPIDYDDTLPFVDEDEDFPWWDDDEEEEEDTLEFGSE